jgi:hypothetical protein
MAGGIALTPSSDRHGEDPLRVALDELPAGKEWGLRTAGLIGRGHGAS